VSLTEPSTSRLLPVRLTQIRPDVRYRAAQQIAERDPADGAQVLYAALNPSDTVYFVALEALPVLRMVAA
jgi:hypothetical protein